MLSKIGKPFAHKTGRLVAKYTVDKAQKSIYGATPKEIKDKYDAIYMDYHGFNVKVEPAIDSSLALGEWLDVWLGTYVKNIKGANTYDDYEISVRRHIKPALGNVKLSDLTTMQLQQFFNDKYKTGRADNREGGLSSKSIKNLRGTLNVAFKQAMNDKKLASNPIIGTVVPINEETEEVMTVLTKSEEEAIMTACRSARSIITFGIIFARHTGIRLGGLLGLTWDSVDFDNKYITVKQSVGRKKDLSDDAQNKTKLQASKTKSRRIREIPLYDALVDELLEYKRKQELLYGRNTEYVFPNNVGKISDPKTYQELFYDMVKTAGVSHKNFHCLRHTFATRCVEQGMDILVLSKLLGHAQPSTTLNKYGRVLGHHKVNSMQAMAKYHV